MKKILLVLLLAIAGLLAFAATKPGTFRYARSIEIDAPAEKIFPYINELKQWAAWSPFEKLDTNLKRTYSPINAGVGAWYEWEGNSEAGAGRYEITGSTRPNSVVAELKMTKPMAVTNLVEFTLVQTAMKTNVTWAMSGTNPFVAKIFMIFIDTEKMCTDAFVEGLANLKALAEK